MTVRLVKSILPPASPAAAVYAALNEATHGADEALAPPPFKRKRLPPVGHQQARSPRQLSDKQRRTFLGEAVKRIVSEVADRGGRYLRRLDTIHESGRRSRAELWQSLRAIAEPFLARLDIATGCIGWLDDSGRFRLNRQNRIAEDAGISPVAICRLFKALEKAGYTLRKLKRIYRAGQNWITRVTIYVRPRFFIDLGLGLAHANARTAKALSFIKKRRRIEATQQQERLDETARAHERRMSHRQAEARRAEQDRQAKHDQRLQTLRSDAAILMELAMAYPGRPPEEYRAMLKQRKGE